MSKTEYKNGDGGRQCPLIIKANGIRKLFPIKVRFLGRSSGVVIALDGVDVDIIEGETLGIAGESGCGKTTLGRCLINLIEPTEGSIRFRSRILSQNNELIEVDLRSLIPKQMQAVRRETAYIFQDPVSSLNPRMRVRDIVSEPLTIQDGWRHRKDHSDTVATLLESVGMQAADMGRYPHEFSGGQRQRIGIARALALQPRLVICDEPTSALDVSVQGQIINLLRRMQIEHALTYVFISHNLSVVQHVSDRVAIMYLGQIVEIGECNEVYAHPLHPYTEVLLSSVQVPDPDYRHERILLKGEVPSLINPPGGCRFHPRCRYAQQICSQEGPRLVEFRGDHRAACHLAGELTLIGVG